MARYGKLDREALLDAAYEVILTQGAHALSIGNVAKAAGVTKGGIQSNFGTRENLIEALFERWGRDLDDQIAEAAQSEGAPTDPMLLFLQACRSNHRVTPRQDAAMMFLMSQNEELRESSRKWISEKLERFGLNAPGAGIKRLHFLVVTALITMKSMELTSLSEEDWDNVFEELETILETSADA
jgi:AcrR family transcriptional regulator